MALKIMVYLLIFWVMQVTAQMFFKWGSTEPQRWLWGFFSGNAFGFSSIWLLMLLYKELNPNIALGIGTAGAFLISQVALSLLFKSKLLPLQWIGIIAIAAGMMALSAGKFR